MRVINKVVDNNGIVRINDLTFFQFSNSFRGSHIYNKTTGRKVPRFLFFWWGVTVSDIRKYFDIRPRDDN